MKSRNIIAAFACALCMMTTVVRANDAGITYTGDAESFIKTTDQTNAFAGMMPGESRTQTIQLTNENYDSMKFFVRVDDTTLLDKGQTGNIVYDISFSKDNEVFYSGKIGGKTKVSKDNLDENYLLKDLKKGDSTDIEMTIKIDGTSMTNDYQGKAGDLGFIFSVTHSDDDKVVEIVKKIPVINKIPGVSTGDTTSIYSIVAVALASLLLGVIIIIKKRKDEKHEA